MVVGLGMLLDSYNLYSTMEMNEALGFLNPSPVVLLQTRSEYDVLF